MVCIKEMRKSCNFGIDQKLMFEAKQKNVLRLKGLHVPGPHPGELVTSKTLFLREEGGSIVANQKPMIYFVSSCLGDVLTDMRFTHATNEAEKVLQAKQAIQSLVSILIFRAIFGVTDTNFSNVLVADDKLYSVDENSVGKFKLQEVLKHKPVRRMFKEALVSSKKFGLKNLLSFLPSWVNSEGDKNEIEISFRS